MPSGAARHSTSNFNLNDDLTSPNDEAAESAAWQKSLSTTETGYLNATPMRLSARQATPQSRRLGTWSMTSSKASGICPTGVGCGTSRQAPPSARSRTRQLMTESGWLNMILPSVWIVTLVASPFPHRCCPSGESGECDRHYGRLLGVIRVWNFERPGNALVSYLVNFHLGRARPAIDVDSNRQND